jgi:hypothetical protein
MNTQNEELNKRIEEEKIRVEKLMKEFKLQRAITLLTCATVYIITVVGIVVVVNKLDGSLPKE